MTDRVELGVDGNAGFALLGENIHDGESEFETIVCSEPMWTAEYRRQSLLAINRAFTRLKSRLGRGNLSYFLGNSHPDYLG